MTGRPTVSFYCDSCTVQVTNRLASRDLPVTPADVDLDVLELEARVLHDLAVHLDELVSP